jgi:hypothetical protein
MLKPWVVFRTLDNALQFVLSLPGWTIIHKRQKPTQHRQKELQFQISVYSDVVTCSQSLLSFDHVKCKWQTEPAALTNAAGHSKLLHPRSEGITLRLPKFLSHSMFSFYTPLLQVWIYRELTERLIRLAFINWYTFARRKGFSTSLALNGMTLHPVSFAVDALSLFSFKFWSLILFPWALRFHKNGGQLGIMNLNLRQRKAERIGTNTSSVKGHDETQDAS